MCLIRAPVLCPTTRSRECWNGSMEALPSSATSSPPHGICTALARLLRLGCSWSRREIHAPIYESVKEATRRSRSTPCIQGEFGMHLRICTRDCADGGLPERPAIDRSALCSAQTLAGGYAPGPQMALSYRHSLPAIALSYRPALQYENTQPLTTTSGYLMDALPSALCRALV